MSGAFGAFDFGVTAFGAGLQPTQAGADIAVTWTAATARGDWAVRIGDLQVDPGGLRSAVMLSLFTDRVAPPGFVPPPGSNPSRRGWWGDTFEDSPIGSQLWTLDRSKKSDDVTLLNEAREMCVEALEWLVTMNVAASVDVKTGWQRGDTIALVISITKPNGLIEAFNYDYAWLGA